MAYSEIILDESEGIATITLNRPDKLNAFTETMSNELLDALIRAEQDKSVRVVIITGAGRAFCAGADLKDTFLKIIEDRKAGIEGYDILSWMVKACLQFRSMSKPTIASINGHAIGLGLTIPLQCDIRIASEAATMSLPFVKVGVLPEFGSTYTLSRIIGIGKACELVFTGKSVTAQEAKEINLVNEVVPPAELETATRNLAISITEGAPIAIKMAKRGLYMGMDGDIENQLQYEKLAFDMLWQQEDHEEAVRAFLEKRKPVFKGK